jgi:inner membrane protein
MDPVTHALLGAAGGLVATRARSRIAALAGAAGALLPDIDVLIGSDTDPLVTLEFHRQFTHSIFVAPFGATIVALALWFALKRRHGLLPLLIAAFAGYVSAILLDACTSYGTQLLWPFYDKRFAAGVVAVIDPAVTVILLAGVISALRSATATGAGVAIALTVVYLGFGWLQRERAETLVAQAAAGRGHTIRQHTVKPTLGNLVLWRSVYLSDKEYVVDAARVGFFSVPVLYTGGAVRRVEPIDLVPPLTLNSIQAADVVRFAKVSDGWLARHPSRPDVIGDIRYSILPNSTRPLWGIEIHPELEEHHVAFHTFRQFTSQDRARFFDMLRGVAPPSLSAVEPEHQGQKKSQGKNRNAR